MPNIRRAIICLRRWSGPWAVVAVLLLLLVAKIVFVYWLWLTPDPPQEEKCWPIPLPATIPDRDDEFYADPKK